MSLYDVKSLLYETTTNQGRTLAPPIVKRSIPLLPGLNAYIIVVILEKTVNNYYAIITSKVNNYSNNNNDNDLKTLPTMIAIKMIFTEMNIAIHTHTFHSFWLVCNALALGLQVGTVDALFLFRYM